MALRFLSAILALFASAAFAAGPEVRIKDLVEEDVLPIERYESYINMLRSLQLGNADVGR